MNLFEIFKNPNLVGEPEESKSFIESFVEFFSSEEFKKNENPFKMLIDFFCDFPSEISNTIQNIDFGWIPNLPDFSIDDIFTVVNEFTSQDCADKVMLAKLGFGARNKLFKLLYNKVKTYGHAQQTLTEAIKSFQNKSYTACSLCLFALIDSCFLKGQPLLVGRKRRCLAKVAVDKIGDKEILSYSIVAQTSRMLIRKLFSDGEDFNLAKENGLNRNYISHGMNSYLPDKIDCLKLFVLLYNIYFLFDLELFKWKQENA